MRKINYVIGTLTIRGATRAADVTNILNREILRICPVLKEDLQGREETVSDCRKTKFSYEGERARYVTRNDPEPKATLLCGNSMNLRST